MLAHDADTRHHEDRHDGTDAVAFKIVAQRNRMIAEWSARVMGMTESEATDLRTAVVALGVRPYGGEAIVDRVLAEFHQRGIDIAEDDICAEMRRLLVVAEDRARGTFWPAALAA